MWKEKLKKYGVPGIILIIILTFIIGYYNANDSDFLNEFQKLLSEPFKTKLLAYDENAGLIHRGIQFSFLIFIYGCLLIGIIMVVFMVFSIFKKKQVFTIDNTTHNSFIELEDRLGDVLMAFENKLAQNQVSEKVTIFMNTKQIEIKRLFGVSDRDIDFVWYFEGKNNDVEMVYFKDPADIDVAGKLIDRALYMSDVRVNEPFVNNQTGLQNSPIKQFITVRNYGNLKLGLAVFLLKENIFNEQNLQEFTYLTSKIILLGTHTRFLNQVKKKKYETN